MSETVKNVGTRVADLSDGRTIGPGETADDVAIGNPHNKDLLDQGMIAVVGAAPQPPADTAPDADRPARSSTTPSEKGNA